MVDFSQILARVTIHDILADAGYRPVRNRLACPIHDGNNPTAFSFTDSTFYCFSCDAKGGLLDLVGYLYHCTRQEALRHLCRMAGIPFDEKESGSRPRSHVRSLPYRIYPLIEDDEYCKAKNRLEWLKLYQDGQYTNLRIIRRNVEQGKMPLEGFYPREEILLYQLEGLEPVIAEATWKVNEIKRRIRKDENTALRCES